MSEFLIFLFVLQGFFILFDEFHFHIKRGLPKWERIGHPLDTLSFLACFAFTLFFAPTKIAVSFFLFLSAFSCIFVTKDEFIHAEKCPAGEQWVHSILFILHPVCLVAIYRFWITQEYRPFVLFQTSLMSLFMLYQFFFWQLFRPVVTSDDAKD